MKTIILLSGVKYNSTKQRPHHMASFFAKKGYRVIYIGLVGQSEVISRNELNSISVDDLLKKYSWQTDDGIYVIKRIKINKESRTEELCELLSKLEKGFISKNVTFLVAFPDWVEHLKEISHECKVIYDCMDDWDSFVSDLNWGYTQKIIQNERKLASMANLVIASAKSLYLKMAYLNENVFYLPNGVWNKDYNTKINLQLIPQDINKINNPIVLFMGAIAGWVDINLIKYLAESRIDYSFVFIGSKVRESLPNLKNIYFLGHKKYDELPFYLSKAKVAIIPFKVNKLTAAVTPLKFYEYLSSATPVVTTMMPDLLGLLGSKTASNYKEFLNYIDNYIEMEKNEYLQESSNAIITSKEFDWNILLEPLCSFVDDVKLPMLSTSEFIDSTIVSYKEHNHNYVIKNELIALYNYQEKFNLSCKLINFNDLKENTQIDLISMSLAYLKEDQIEKAILLLEKYCETDNLLSIYINSLIKEPNKKLLLEILLLKLSGDVYGALRLTDKSLSIDSTDAKLLGLLSGLYNDLGEYEISLHYTTEALNRREYYRIEEILDISCITFLINVLLKEKNYTLAEEVTLSLMKVSKEWEEKAILLLSDIYLLKHMTMV